MGEPCRNFVNHVIDIELAYVNTNHPAQNELYKQIGHGSDDKESIRSNKPKQAAPINPKQQQPQQQQVKSAPSPPQSEQSSNANNGGKGWFGFGGKQNRPSKDNTNPFSNEMQSNQASNVVQQQRAAQNSSSHQQRDLNRRRKRSNDQ